MKKLISLCVFLLCAHLVHAQYTTIEGRNISTSSPTLYIVYHGNNTGYPDCDRVSHTLPTGPLTGSFVPQTPSSLTWVGGTSPTALNAINIVRPLGGGGTESGPLIDLCAPLKPPFTITFPMSGATVTVTLTNMGGGVVRVNIN